MNHSTAMNNLIQDGAPIISRADAGTLFMVFGVVVLIAGLIMAKNN